MNAKLKTMCDVLRELHRQRKAAQKKVARLRGKNPFQETPEHRKAFDDLNSVAGLTMRQERAILDYVMEETK